MKQIIKIFSLIFVLVFSTSCENSSEDMGYNAQEEFGWVQFLESNPSAFNIFQGAVGSLDLGVNIQVPTTSSDLTINYDLVSISGLNPNSVFSNNGRIVSPAGETSYMGPDNNTGADYIYLPKISFDLDELLGATIDEPMIFDVVLSSTSSSKISVGLAGESFPVTQRVVIYPTLEDFIGTYDVAEAFVAGVNTGLSLGAIFGELYQIDIERVSGDTTGAKMTLANSTGFSTYFLEGAEITFDVDGSFTIFNNYEANGFTEDGGFVEDGNTFVALFRILEIQSGFTSYDYDNLEIIGEGPLATFGDYRFTLTKQ